MEQLQANPWPGLKFPPRIHLLLKSIQMLLFCPFFFFFTAAFVFLKLFGGASQHVGS